MEGIGIYNNCGIKQTIFGIRDIRKENYNLAIHYLIGEGRFTNCIQVLINFLGDLMWINANKNDVIVNNIFGR